MTLSIPSFIKHHSASPETHTAAELPHTPGLGATYEDMTPGGMAIPARLKLGNLATLDVIVDALETSNTYLDDQIQTLRNEGQEESAAAKSLLRQPYLIHMLHDTRQTYQEYPNEAKPALIDETARQTRMFIGRAANGEVEGLTPRMVEDLKFLNIIMPGLNVHPPLPEGQSLNLIAEQNKYVTNESRTGSNA